MKKINYILKVLVLFCLVTFSQTIIAQINTPAGATKPFGTNNGYAFGIMPTNLPTSGTFGKASDIATTYNNWKATYIENCGTDKARVRFDNTSETVSEGIAYGMLLAAYAADRDLFNRLWAYYKQHRNANGVMHWKISGCNNVIGQNGATDAELDAAMALIVADYQWPNTTTPHNYKTDAVALINAIRNFEINATDFTFENGDAWKPACRNPSYQAPGYARVFKVFMANNGQANNAFWDNVINRTELLLANNAHTTSGLATNWCTPAGPPSSSCSGSGTAPDKFGYDACRAPWRQGVNYLWYGPSNMLTITNRQAAFWIGRGGASQVQGGDGVNHDGSGTGNHNAAFVGPIGAMSLAVSNTTANQNFCNALYTTNRNDALATGYFTKILQMIGLFVQTGNFWNPYAQPLTTTVAITAPTLLTHSEGDIVNVDASATASSGAISKVDFYIGNTLIGTDNIAPYSTSWTADLTGNVSLTAVATNTNGDVVTSSATLLTIYKSITQTSSAPTIDGSVDALWSNATSASLTKTISGTITNATDLSANYKAMWDNTNLYVLVNVTDDVKTNNGGTDVYNDDAVEIFIDIGNNKSTTYGANDFQYTFRWNDPTIYNSSGGALTGITFAQTNTANGYIMEIRMPWSTLTGSPTLNQLVGFEVEINDDDDGTARDGKLAWNASADNTWQNPSYMGTAILKGSACTLPGAAGAITGSAAVCANATGVTYSIAAVTGATSYNWTVPTGATITAGAGTRNITVTFGATAGNVTVTPVGACGNGTAANIAVTINAATGAAGTITGSTAVCANATGVTYSIAAVTGATSYNWTVPTGATITAGAGTRNITVTFGATAGNVTVTPVGACGNGTAANIAVTINAATGAAGAITGSAAVCANATGVTYSIAAVTGATSYNWTIPTGATITAGAGTRNITVTFGATAGNVTVTPVGACGNGTAANIAVTINAATGAAGTITGSTAVCANATGVTYSIAAVTGATSYNWTVPTGATITAGAGTRNITVTFGATAGNVTVTPVGACGNGTAATRAVTINAATGAAGTITGSAAVCANATGVTYSIAAVTGATSYNWTVPTGATITAGAGTRNITVTFGATAGNVTVTPVGACGNGTAATRAVTINAATGAAGTITGSAAVCANATGVTYSIAAVTGATSYNWTVPTGATITAGAGTRNITVTFGATAGNVTVTPIGGCGNGTAATRAVSVGSNLTPTVSLAVSPGTTIYSGQMVTFTATPNNGGTSPSYIWKINGSVISGQTSNTYSTSALANNDIVSVQVVSNLTCVTTSTSAAATRTMSVSNAPFSSSVTGPSTVTANQTNVTYSVPAQAGFTYVWTVPAGATIVSGQGTNSIVVDFGTSSGNVSVTESVTNGPSKTTSLPVYVNPASLSTTNVYGTLNASLFPIPCETSINIDLGTTTGEVKYTIYEVTGNEIEKGTFVYSGAPFEITAPSASGTYLIKLETDSKTSVQRFVKK